MSDSFSVESLLSQVNATTGRLAEFPAADGAAPLSEVGSVHYVAEGVARVRGLPGVASQEVVAFESGARGTAFSLLENDVAVMLLDPSDRISSGEKVRRTGSVISVPVGEALLGRVVDPIGRPLDGGAAPDTGEVRRVEQPAPGIMDRKAVSVPLQTGVQVIDALVPIGRGQRELIVGDRQTGKSAIAIDTIINQRDSGVLSVYCAVGQRSSAVARVLADLKRHGAMDRSVVVATTEDDPPGANVIAPYAATSIAEFFVSRGRDVLIIYDDLTRHARSYRELSLLLRRPPAREAYPGDIFYVHSRLLERATQLDEEHGGGSLTALPIVETEEENLSAYIPTNLVSITDGQIYLSPSLYSQGVLPPVDVGKSVSRVGGSAQAPAYRAVAGDLRLSYSQFEELESFARFGVRLDAETQQKLDRGRRVRELLKQPQYAPLSAADQIVALEAVTSGALDPIPVDDVDEAKKKLRQTLHQEAEPVAQTLDAGEELSDEQRERLDSVIGTAMKGFAGGNAQDA